MLDIILKFLPVILIFLVWIIIRYFWIAKKEDAEFLLKLIFYVSLPALIILSVYNTKFTISFIYLPIIAVLLILSVFFISFFVWKKLNLSNESFWVFLIWSMIMNVWFTLPFVIAAYWQEWLTRSVIFDFWNLLLVFTFVYYFAVKYGNSKTNIKIYKKLLYAPPVWALFFSFVLKYSQITIPSVFTDFLSLLGNLTIPLIMLSLGIYFNLKIRNISTAFVVIFIRMFIGLFLGLLFCYLFNLEWLDKAIVLISAAAPSGYNTLTYSSLEKLNIDLAADIVSYSIFVGMFFVPILIYFLNTYVI